MPERGEESVELAAEAHDLRLDAGSLFRTHVSKCLGEFEMCVNLGDRSDREVDESGEISIGATPRSFGDVGDDGDRRPTQLRGQSESFLAGEVPAEGVHLDG